MGDHAAGPVHGITDIGMCDMCGTEDGPRHRVIVPGVGYDGQPRRVLAWLCEACKRAEGDDG